MQNKLEVNGRRRGIVECFHEHGATATAKQFSISWQRVYQIIEVMQNNCIKPTHM